MLQGKRDVDTVLTMGIMEDVSIVPQPAGGKCYYVTYDAIFHGHAICLYISFLNKIIYFSVL